MPAYEMLQQGLIDGIRCSTRPDAVGDEAITLLQSYGVKTVELGVQSMNDGILVDAKRGAHGTRGSRGCYTIKTS